MTQLSAPDLQARISAENRGHWLCVVPRRWKHRMLLHYLQGADTIRFRTSLPKRLSGYRGVDHLLVWGRLTPVPPAVQEAYPQLTVVTAEDGFVTSRGLALTGSYLYSLLLDRRGVHFDASRPSDLLVLLNSHRFSAADERMGRELIALLREARLSKSNLAEAGDVAPLLANTSREKILVVGQLEDDNAIRLSLSPIRTNLQLLQEVRRLHPTAWVVFKPHPIELLLGSFGKRRAQRYLALCDQIALEGPISEWIDAVDAVHLISSTAGLEALIRGKPVHTYGTPIYAGWGLTHDWAVQPDRQRPLSLEQLVAITHGLYPRYFNWTTGRFETALETLQCLQRLETGQESECFFDADLQRAQQLTQRWRRGRVALLKPLQAWRRRRVQRMLEQLNR